MLGLYYSMAMHMWITLGQWPGIGENGFPLGLLIHARILQYYAEGWIIWSVFCLPLAIIFTVLARKRFQITKCLAFQLLAFAVVLSVMNHLVPAGFLNWWRD